MPAERRKKKFKKKGKIHCNRIELHNWRRSKVFAMRSVSFVTRKNAFFNSISTSTCFSDHLKIHMKTHDNQKPFQCTVCNRGYNTAAALTSHMQNHKRSSENSANAAPPGTTFKCLQCAEIFRKPEELQVNSVDTSRAYHPFSHFRLKIIKPLNFSLFQKHMNTHQQPSDNPPALNNSRTKTSSYPAIHSEYTDISNCHSTFSDVV